MVRAVQYYFSSALTTLVPASVVSSYLLFNTNMEEPVSSSPDIKHLSVNVYRGIRGENVAQTEVAEVAISISIF